MIPRFGVLGIFFSTLFQPDQNQQQKRILQFRYTPYTNFLYIQ